MEIIPPVLCLAHHMGQIIEHFMIGTAFPHLNDLTPGQNVTVSFPVISNVIHFKPGGRRQHDIGELLRRFEPALGLQGVLELGSFHDGRRAQLANGGLDVVQPDLYYFGGMIRSLKVANMGHVMGKKCVPHLSGGFGFIYMLHLVSAMSNAGPHIEFKGYTDLPIECPTSSLRVEDGKIKVPTGPGIGVEIDPDYINKHRVVRDV